MALWRLSVPLLPPKAERFPPPPPKESRRPPFLPAWKTCFASLARAPFRNTMQSLSCMFESKMAMKRARSRSPRATLSCGMSPRSITSGSTVPSTPPKRSPVGNSMSTRGFPPWITPFMAAWRASMTSLVVAGTSTFLPPKRPSPSDSQGNARLGSLPVLRWLHLAPARALAASGQREAGDRVPRARAAAVAQKRAVRRCLTQAVVSRALLHELVRAMARSRGVAR
mmetsp:Transcript_120746/g.352640  ORF Transcript_120746/g.352640 Transcript_120746/m.352640 type:complete len:226 (+) Transcript_120746:466-1143(+)